MPLRCVSRYKSSLGAWQPGEAVDVDPATEAHLLRDAPEAFEIVTPAPEAPPVDKMLRPSRRKTEG